MMFWDWTNPLSREKRRGREVVSCVALLTQAMVFTAKARQRFSLCSCETLSWRN